jgi:hypothetical protein
MNNNTTPWLTKEGFFDPANFPIEGILKQAVSDDESQFRSALMMLQTMHHHGRTEAGMFLLGMLVTWQDDWEQRIAIVEAVTGIKTQACVDLLFRELKRVRSSNTTRRYLTVVLKVLVKMPSELVLPGFDALANDNFFTAKMRKKFQAILEEVMFDEDQY